MPTNLNSLHAFGKRVRQAQDAALMGPGGDDAIREARARWRGSPRETKPAHWTTDRGLWVGALLGLAASAWILFSPPHHAPRARLR